MVDNPNARSVDQTFNMFGVLLNFLVTPAETVVHGKSSYLATIAAADDRREHVRRSH
jgi:hypothetical protein